ncbi:MULTISPECIES: hypothetical protein [unclassified Ruegeria]|uniref:hypothetical protein n=1 Tax=unclassified Ruegeria TaxID=2625375 RepID=UPI001488AA9A|nr:MULTISPECIES: hypothetical protein [unclassified Ruegeria]NOD34485.1 hypothetical protein [Ruegeria sp. HKCCD7296]NOD47598.1 hypothetical protein [Ruegeria sp. HKCCD5849]NOD52739.1 hypothetical protein [Ruegeria sp. HKCCD5851]NOD66158.1 hypothetical protein [Ruegeria sp. HKCCD7303]NOE40291.1 hypothetical protein [Ruegeria sp. HKCCD7319]
MNPLHLAGRHGPYVLICGLAAGLLLPALAEPMRDLLPPLVVLLLFVTVLRMDPRTILGSLSDLHKVAFTVVGFQLVTPMIIVALGYVCGWIGTPVLLSLLIMAAAPSISGSPNMCLMMGHAPEHAMRLMVVGTALLPLTALPIFLVMPQLGDVQSVLWAGVRLLLTILCATGAAIFVRRTVLRNPSQSMLMNLEGMGTLTLAVFVIGLMPSVSATALEDPALAAFWIAFACLANFGAQIVMFRFTQGKLPAAQATAVSLIAGNRNIAIFFVALPTEVTAPIMAFIGAYQIPMYLTPMIMRRLYQKNAPS